MAQDLFIPNKTQPHIKQPEYGTDMRAIEIWAKNIKPGISEITSLDGSVIITDPNGPTTDLSVNATIYHVLFGLAVEIEGVREGWGSSADILATDSGHVSVSIGPVFSSGGILITQTNQNTNPTPFSGTLTLSAGDIYISDATMTNTLRLSNSSVSLSLFGGPILGWTNAAQTGTVITLGTPQNTQLVTSTSNTTPFWINAQYQVHSSGL